MRLAAPRCVSGRRDRARELCQLELVGEQPRRHALPRLDEVDDAEPDVDARERHAAAGGRRRASAADLAARGVATRSLGRRAEDGGGIEIDLAADEPARDFRAAARFDDGVQAVARRARGSSRGLCRGVAADRPSRSRRASPTTGTPWIRRPAERGSSSTNADRRARRASRAARAAGSARSGRRRRSACAAGPRGRRSVGARARRPRSQKRDAPISSEQSEEVDEEDAAREAVPRHGRPDEEERGGLRDERRPRRCSPRRARPRTARRRGTGRRAMKKM